MSNDPKACFYKHLVRYPDAYRKLAKMVCKKNNQSLPIFNTNKIKQT